MFACLHAPGNVMLLVDCACHFSPLVEETSPDAVLFDVRGLGRLFGTPLQLAQAIHRQLGVPANLAIASNPDAAHHAAQGIQGMRVIASGEEAAVLAPLPVYLLGGSPEFARTLDLWGIRTFGEFAALPPLGVAARLGEEGTYRRRLASGAVQRQLRPRSDAVEYRAGRELEDSIDCLEPVLFLLSGMLNEVLEKLSFHGQSANELRLRLKLERAPDYLLNLQFPVPMRDAKVFLKLIQLELEQKLPPAPIEQVDLQLLSAKPRVTQQGLFLPSSPEPEKLEITLARIRNLVGEANVGAPQLLDTHRPDSFRLTSLALVPSASDPPAPKLALRRFRPPCPVQVWCAPDGRPIRLVSRLGQGAVVKCAGPWSSSGEWWTNTPWDRRDWDVEVENLALFRIFRDSLRRQWFIDGIYD